MGAQKLVVGGTTEWVHAVADELYMFAQWSDGRKDNPRRDVNVQADREIKAQFVDQAFRVEYEIGPGGHLVSGELVQYVRYQEESAAVTVAPDEGYYFYRWSDFVSEPTRTDQVQGDPIFEVALFRKYVMLLDEQSFESGFGEWIEEVEDWEAHTQWGLADKALLPGVVLDGQFARVDVRERTSTEACEGRLLSLRYLLDGVTKEIELEFNYLFYATANSSLTVQYSLDGEAWEDLEVLAGASSMVLNC